jgi:hypothetical protein
MKRLIFAVILLGSVLWGRSAAHAQDWQKVLQLEGTYGASAFFFNANEGLIGTGHYLSSIPARIYYTNDGGTTWEIAQFANPNIRGQVTDIYFRDREHGWATIREASETGWSGVYRSTDGGQSWVRVKQAGFPAGIRETSRGVFYTDRDIDPGVMFSSDTGKTWTHVASTVTALGIDFMDDSTGFVTSQAASSPHLYTTNGGRTWQSITTSSEAWTPYADPISRSFFLASESDQLTLSTQTTIVKVPINSWSESKIKNYGDSGITGGIAGSHICQSVIYVQGREPASFGPDGIIRTMDAGVSWVFIGGPNNINDKRFAVTGRGAVVVAFDNNGGVWRTVDGGDGTLSPSVLPFVTVVPPGDTIQSTLCDSVIIPVLLEYHSCDSAQIAAVKFLNDSLHELSAPGYDNNYRYFSSSRVGKVTIVYRPLQKEAWNARIVLTIRQPDGYTEDTMIVLPLVGTASPKNVLLFSGTSVRDTVDFDSVSICSDAFRTVTMNNFGCGDITVDSIFAHSPLFSLSSNFRPFVLSVGNSRTFLLHFTPDSIGRHRGVLYVTSSVGLDSVILSGTGYSSGEAVSLDLSDSILSSECDSMPFTLNLKNIACKAFKVDSVITSPPFYSRGVPADSILSNEDTVLNLAFVPNKIGNTTGSIHLVVSYAGTGRYDTTITVIGTGIAGSAHFGVSKDSLPMGSVPICSYAIDTLIVFSSGCEGVSLSAEFDSSSVSDPTGFSLVRAPNPSLPPSGSDTVIVAYHPDHSMGRKSVDLIFTTSAGTDTVPVSINVVSGEGAVAFGVTPNIHAYTCQSQPFSVSISNGLCDSILIDSITLGGANAGDFSLADSLPISLGSAGQRSFSGVFTPEDSLTRTAQLSIEIREADGTVRDTTMTLAGIGIGVPPIQVALNVTNLSAGAGQIVTIPVIAKQGSTTNLSTFDLTLLFNTDLLSPLPLNTSSNGFFGNATGQTLKISRATNRSHLDTVNIHLQRGSEAILPSGELFELVCEAFVTSVTSTGITLHGVQFQDASGSEQCLTSETVPDTTATFILNQACGDTTIEQVLGSSILTLDGISPNPTTGLVQMTFDVPANYSNDDVLEIYNALGERLGEQEIVFPMGTSGKETFDLDLNSEMKSSQEGVLYLRIQTPQGALTAKVILLSQQ